MDTMTLCDLTGEECDGMCNTAPGLLGGCSSHQVEVHTNEDQEEFVDLDADPAFLRRLNPEIDIPEEN